MPGVYNRIHLNNNHCCGCSACALNCPTKAIRMSFNECGNYVPEIDEKMCIHCSRCENICRTSQNQATELSKDYVYVAVAKNREVLKRSSSGGAAYILSNKALELGYPLCGVAYDTKGECAKHILVKDKEDLVKLQGSKYLQSKNHEAFGEILAMESGVIFGTPCQICAADSLLRIRNKRDSFLLVDIFCHGVPVQLLWKNHLTWLKKTGRVEDHCVAVFREGKRYRLKIGDYQAWYNQDAFYTFFLLGLLKNQACYDCSLRRKSCADLRIGDCMVHKYDRLGFSPSTIIANTDYGMKFLELCRDDMDIYTESYAIVDGIQERDNMPQPLQYDERIKLLQDGKAPEDIIHYTMIMKRIKSFVKHNLLGCIDFRKSVNDLGSLLERNQTDF